MNFFDFERTDTYKDLYKEVIIAGTEEELRTALKHYFEEVKKFSTQRLEDDLK